MTAAAPPSVLLALSDTLVVRALERAAGKMPRAVRRPDIPRHHAYRATLINSDPDRLLANAWTVCGELAYRWELPVDSAAWARALDGYCRALLATRREHTLDDLDRALNPLRLHHAC